MSQSNSIFIIVGTILFAIIIFSILGTIDLSSLRSEEDSRQNNLPGRTRDFPGRHRGFPPHVNPRWTRPHHDYPYRRHRGPPPPYSPPNSPRDRRRRPTTTRPATTRPATTRPATTRPATTRPATTATPATTVA